MIFNLREKVVKFNSFILHLYEIVEGLYFHCSLSVYMCVYVSVCLSVSVCVCQWKKIQPSGSTNGFGRGLLILLAQILLKLMTVGQMWRSQWLKVYFSLLKCVFVLWISTILYPITMKIGVSLSYMPFGGFVFKIKWLMTSFKISQNNCPYLKFYWKYYLVTCYQYTTT